MSVLRKLGIVVFGLPGSNVSYYKGYFLHSHYREGTFYTHIIERVLFTPTLQRGYFLHSHYREGTFYTHITKRVLFTPTLQRGYFLHSHYREGTFYTHITERVLFTLTLQRGYFLHPHYREGAIYMWKHLSVCTSAVPCVRKAVPEKRTFLADMSVKRSGAKPLSAKKM